MEFQYLDEGNSEAQDRLATSYLFAQTSPGLATTGVLSGLTVAQTTTASGSVLIAAGASAVQASVGTGVALLVNDTLKTLDVFTANPMGGLPRNDIVAFDSVTKTVAVIKGEPNAAPTDPTVPATACALARLRHAASATTIPTAKIDSLRVITGLAGTAASATAAGIVELATSAEAVTGTDTARAVTPAGVAAAIAGDAWTTFTLAAGFSAVGSYPAQFRVSGGWCELRGIAQSSTSVITSADGNLVAAGNAPAALSASSVFRLIAAITDGGATPLSGFATLNPRIDGGIRIRATVAGGVFVTLDGLRYRTS